jgi:phosphate/sulfate permease
MYQLNTEIIASLINAGATLLIGLFVAWISHRYNINSSKMEHDRLSKELFKEFNERYDKLNHFLYKIAKECKTLKDLENNLELEYKLIDFFNLCAEEHFWYKKGRIDEAIWFAWSDGMNDWYNNVGVISEVWDAEIKKRGCKSYYIKQKNDFFKND